VPLLHSQHAVLPAGLSNSTHALLDTVLMDFVPRVRLPTFPVQCTCTASSCDSNRVAIPMGHLGIPLLTGQGVTVTH